MTKKANRPGSSLDVHYESVLGDIPSVIDAARKSAARSANCIMTAAYWLIGRRIVESEQKNGYQVSNLDYRLRFWPEKRGRFCLNALHVDWGKAGGKM